MIEDYVGKKCKITILFSQPTCWGPLPMWLVGTISKTDNEFVEIEFDPNEKHCSVTKTAAYFANLSGKILVKRDYIVSIALM